MSEKKGDRLPEASPEKIKANKIQYVSRLSCPAPSIKNFIAHNNQISVNDNFI